MEGNTKEKVEAAQGKEQSSHKKPFFVMAPPETPFSASSSFLPKPYALGYDAGGSSGSAAKSSCPQFASASGCPAYQAAKENNKMVENPTADPNMDSEKLKRIITNPLLSERERKRIQYLTEAEEQVKNMQEQIKAFRSQVESDTNQKQILISEQKTLGQQLAAPEKEKLLKDGNMAPKFSSEDILLQRQRKQNKKRPPAIVPDPVESFEETNSILLQQKRRRADENPSSSIVEGIDISKTTKDINRAAGNQVEVGNAVAASAGVVDRMQEKDWELCSVWDALYPVGNFIDKHLSAPMDLEKYKRVGGQGLSYWMEANALRAASIARANQKEFHSMKRYIELLEEKVRLAGSVHAKEKETLEKQIGKLEGLIGVARTLGESLAKAQERITSLEADASKLAGAEKRAEIAEKEVEKIRKYNEELIRKVNDLEKQVKQDAETIKPWEKSRQETKDSPAGLNGVETPKTQADTALQPQTQMWLANWNNRLRSIHNYNQ